MDGNTNMRKRLSAEFVASAVLVLGGCLGYTKKSSPVIGAYRTGAITAVIILIFGRISGGYGNPIVTLAAYFKCRIGAKAAIMYIITQLLGSVFGYGLLAIILPPEDVYDCTPGLCMIPPKPNMDKYQVFGMELILTYTMLVGWRSAWVERPEFPLYVAPLLVGCVISSSGICGIHYSAPGLNLATSLAAATFQNDFGQLPLYAAAQIMAAILTYFI